MPNPEKQNFKAYIFVQNITFSSQNSRDDWQDNSLNGKTIYHWKLKCFLVNAAQFYLDQYHGRSVQSCDNGGYRRWNHGNRGTKLKRCVDTKAS